MQSTCSTRRGCSTERSLCLGFSLWLAACSAQLNPGQAASTQRDPATRSGDTSVSGEYADSGLVTRGAGMPIVPIHRADAGLRDASTPTDDAPPVQVSPDASSDAGATPPPDLGNREDAGATPPVPSVDAGQDPAPDGGSTLPPAAALPEPIHRYSFTGAGSNVPDLVGGAAALIHGDAQLDGLGSVNFLGRGDGFVELPGDLLEEVASFTLLVWLTARSDACWQRALDLTNTQQSNAGTLITSLFLTPRGCPERVPTLGYVTANVEHHLVGEAAVGASELFQLGASYSVRSQTLRLIVNGVVQAEQSVALDLRALQGAHGMLGRSQLADPQLQGSITELRVYASRLQPNELREIYARGPDAL